MRNGGREGKDCKSWRKTAKFADSNNFFCSQLFLITTFFIAIIFLLATIFAEIILSDDIDSASIVAPETREDKAP